MISSAARRVAGFCAGIFHRLVSRRVFPTAAFFLGVSASAFAILLPQPVVTSFTPATARYGATVTITGTGFTGATEVRINGVANSAAFTIDSDTQITATIKPVPAQSGTISVVSPGGTGTSAAFFTIDAPAWTLQNPKPVAAFIENATFGAGVYVATTSGSPGLVLTSSDGIAWTVTYANTSGLRAVAYANGKFVATGDLGAILTSTDGLAWTAQVSGTTASLQGIAFGAGKYVALGDGSTVLTSTDAVTWTPQTLGAPGVIFKGEAFGAGLFAGVGAAGNIFTSADGVTWTSQSSGTTNALNEIIFANGKFLAVGDSGAIVNSTNGVTWTVRVPSPATTINLLTATFGNGKFVVGGSGGSVVGGGNLLMTSTDGNTWSIFGAFSDADIRGSTFGNGQFVIVGFPGQISTSPDAVNFTLRTAFTRLAFSDGVYGNGRYVLVGANSSAAVSTDLTHWTLNQTVGGRNAPLLRVAYGAGIFAAAGQSGVVTSPDGVAWSLVNSTQLTAIVYDGNQFVATGNGAVVKSPDGIAWTTTFPVTLGQTNGVASGAGKYVAAGSAGKIYYSTDAVTWTSATTGTTNNLNSVTYGRGLFVAVGEGNTLLTSPDGVTWTAPTVPTSAIGAVKFSDVVAADGLFIVTSVFNSPTSLLVSANGVDWSYVNVGASTLQQGGTLSGIAYGNGRFFLGTANGLIASTQPLGDSLRITTPPLTQAITANQTVTLTVAASGPAGLTYQWYQGVSGDTSTPVSGATNVSFTTDPLAASARFWVRVSNAAGTLFVDSAEADLQGAPAIVHAPPATLAVTDGIAASLSVQVIGPGPFSYQWQLDGVDLLGAVGSSFPIGNGVAAGGVYRVVVSNAAGSIASSPSTVTVTAAAPTVSLSTFPFQPVAASTDANFAVTVSGTAPFTYQWQRNGADLANTDKKFSGANAPQLRVKRVQAADAGTYRCIVTNAVSSVTSSTATLNVSDSLPTFTFQPASQDVSEGSAVFFSVGAKGTGPLLYQWQLNGVGLPGATDSDYAIAAATNAQAGTYTCVISNPAAPSNVGNATSAGAVLTVNASGPIITAQPNQFISILGTNATATVVAIGAPPLSYQWKKNGIAIAGATGATLFLHAIDASAGGTYTVVVSNSQPNGTVESQPATLIVGNPSVVTPILPLPHSGALNGIAYGAGKFVAVGNSGHIRTSPDGVKWTGQPIVGNYQYDDIIFANNQFVVAGSVQAFGGAMSTGVILTSPDGTTWTQRVSDMQFPALRALTFASGVYVAVGDRGAVLTSADAIDWTSRPSGFAGGALSAIAFGAGKFVAVGDGGALTSPDGIAWTTVAQLAGDSFTAVTFANGKFLIGTDDSGFGTSTDGITWTQSIANVSTEDDGNGAVTRIVYAGGLYLATIAESINDFAGLVATSSDGLSWVVRDTTPARNPLNDVAFGGGAYVAVGETGEVLTSTDGIAWTSRRNSPLPSVGFTGVATSPTMNVAVGANGAIAASADGVTWTQRTSNVTTALNAVTYGGGRFVAVGASGVVERSTDGLFWSKVVLNNNPGLFAVTYDGANYIAVGSDGNIQYSPDAVSWTKVGSLPNWTLRGVVASGGVVVAVGNSGVIASASSSNLSTWTQRTSNTTVGLRSIAAGGGKFVAGGLDATLRSQFLSSTDGVTWTLAQAPFSSSINGLVYANGHFSTASGSSAILSSTDGVVWTSEFSGTTDRQLAIAFGPDGYISVGDAGSIITFAANFPPSVTSISPSTPLAGTVVTIAGSGFTGATAVKFNGTATSTFHVDSDTQITATIPASATSGLVTVTTPGGTNVASSGASVTITTPVAPMIGTQPASATVLPGAAVKFEITASGTPAPTYQWFKDAVAISGATTASYGIVSVSAADSGSYACTATNPAGSVTSDAAVLGVKPAITAQPSAASVIEGTTATFTVVATGTAPLTYVWRKDSSVVAGATGATLTLPNVALTAAGGYTVEVGNAFGSVTSSSVALSITALVTAPTIVKQPASLAANPGASATFAVEASGTAPFTYVWKKDTTVIAGATGATLTLTNVTAADVGSYSVTVSNSADSATSSAATLTLNVPVAVGALVGKTVTAGDAVSFAVTASGTAPFAYQWSKNGAALAGQNSATLSIATTATTDSGTYTCTVTNVAGSATASATLTVNPPVLPPVISSAATAAVAINTLYSYQIAASHSPTAYTASPLPAGLNFNATTGLISGAATTAGVYPIALSATNSGGTGTATLTLTVVQAVPVVTSAGQVNARIGDAFTYTITGTNQPTGFAASGLPAGLTVNTSTGVISGTPTGAGATVTVNLTASNATGTGPIFRLVIAVAPALNASIITSAAQADTRVGDPFTYQLTATNSPTSFSVTGLPAGLTLNAATGVIAGTPTSNAGGLFSTGVVVGTAVATNAAGQGPAFTLVFTIAPAAAAPVITSSSGATATIGTAFSYAIRATNSPTSYAIEAGTLPQGLTFDAATGVISGTPTTPESQFLRLSATNAAGTGSAIVSITIIPGASAPVVTSSPTASGRAGVAFTYTIVASNAPTAFSAVNLPSGLTLNSATGIITGSPAYAGTYSVLLSASNTAGSGPLFPLTLTVEPAATAPRVTSAASASGTVGVLFNYQITATNTPTSFNVTGLPAGFNFDALNGVISGTPSVAAISNVRVSASNAAGTSAPLALLINIAPSAQTPVITSSQSAAGTQGTAFTPYQITATNMPATLPVSGNGFDASGLPAGLAVNPGTGVISGTPTATGTFTVTLSAYNLVATSVGRALIVTIAPSAAAPVITSGTSVAAVAGTAFTGYTITATNSPTSLDASGRPAWLTVDTATGVLGGTPTAPGVFTVQLTATNATGASAPSPLSITVTPAAGSPVVTSTLGKTGRANDAFSYQIIASSTGPITGYTAIGLPGGLALNPASGLINGTPTIPGTYQVEIGATNAIGIGGTKILVIDLAAAAGSPVIGGSGTGSSTAGARSAGAKHGDALSATAVAQVESSATVGVPYSFQISASGAPTSFSATGLPAGLAVNPGTGLISGAPAEAGVFEIEIRASNNIGVGASATLVLSVAPPPTTPSMTSAFAASGTAGVAFTYTATASNTPTSYNAAGLPAGLALNAATGAISGTPTAPGTFDVKLSANNNVGTGPAITVAFTIAASAGAPAVTSSATASGTVGAAFNYSAAASHSPTSFTATGLPAGLAIDATTGAITGTPAVAGEFAITLTARNATGASTPFKVTISVLPPGDTPTITSPASASITAGTTFAYATTATNSPGSYNITNLPAGLSANSDTGLIDGVPTTPGLYSIKISANNDSGTGAVLTLALEVVPVGGTPGVPGGVGGSRLINISARGVAGTGEKVLITGFVITGSAPKPVMIRAVGPALVAQGVTGELEDPTLELVQGSAVLSTSDNWGSAGDASTIAATAVRVGAFALGNGSTESVIVTSLAPGVYSAVAHGKGGTTGVAMVEVYDISEALPASSPRLVNLSARGDVGTGANVLIGGFVIAGDTPRQVLLRAVGPGLTPLGVTGALADPKLQVFHGGILVNENDNWGSAGDAAQLATVANTVGAFALSNGSKDAVLLVTLAPGAYTVLVSGAGSTTGVALVEIYEVP